ncbi:MAG TPA: pilus assembly protein [Bryobacteraceae bacterium]|nr:pilus assembly protein [Bryobacteraceae bacterium]
MRISSRRQNQRGNALIESALVLGLFVFVLVGIMDFAQILHVHQSLVERVRSVARTAVVQNLAVEEIRDRIVYGQSIDIRTEAGLMPAGFMGLRREHVTVEILDRTYSEQRLVVDVNGVPIIILSPLMAGQGKNLPLRITIPLEEP